MFDENYSTIKVLFASTGKNCLSGDVPAVPGLQFFIFLPASTFQLRGLVLEVISGAARMIV